jgi:hypothetical protein
MNQHIIFTVLVGIGILATGLGIIIITEKVTLKEKLDQRAITTFKTKVYSLEAEEEAFKLLQGDKDKNA